MSKDLIKAVPHLDGVLYVDEHCEIKVGNMMYDSKTHEVSRLNRGEMPYLWEYQIIAQSNLNIEGVPYAFIEHDPKVKLFSEEDSPWPLHDVLKKLTLATNILLHTKNYDGEGYEEMNICVERANEIMKHLRPTPIGYEVAEPFTDNDKQYIKLKPVY